MLKIKLSLGMLMIFILTFSMIGTGFSISGELIDKPLNNYTIEYLFKEEEIAINDNNYIIEGVPYVGQSTDMYCHYASATMIFQYYGINTTQHDVLYYSGAGYSLAYEFGELKFRPGVDISQMADDMIFLADIYGLSLEFWYPTIIIEQECWESYWNKVRQYLLNNIPIQTCIDPGSIPYYREQFDITDNNTHGSHDIVILGFDEIKGLVYYNDPATWLFTTAEDGTYANMTIEQFRKSVYYTTYSFWPQNYLIWAYEKMSDPIPRKEAIEITRNRNIKRMMGNDLTYDNEYRKTSNLRFGLKGLIAFKIDLLKIPPNNSIPFNTRRAEIISIEKNNISQYLLEISDLSSICKYDSILLKEEAGYWEQLSLLSPGANNNIKKEINKLINKIILTEIFIILR